LLGNVQSPPERRWIVSRKAQLLLVGALVLIIAAVGVFTYQKNQEWYESGLAWTDGVDRLADDLGLNARPTQSGDGTMYYWGAGLLAVAGLVSFGYFIREWRLSSQSPDEGLLQQGRPQPGTED
jgi:hypothetical protein